MSPESMMQILDGGRAFNGGNPPAEVSVQRCACSQSATQRAAANDSRRGAEGVVQGPAQELDRDVENLGATRRARSMSAPTRRTCRRVSPRSRGRKTTVTQPWAHADYGTAYAERAEIYDLVRDAKITGFAIVSGDRHSFWAGYATAELPPGKFEPVGLSFVGASLTSPGPMEAYEHNLPKDAPLRASVPRRQAGTARSRTGPYNMLLKHGVRSCLEYAKSFDLQARPVAVQPGSGSAPRVRRSGRTRLCEGPIVGR